MVHPEGVYPVGNDGATSSKQVHSDGEPGNDGASSSRCTRVAEIGNDGEASYKHLYWMESLKMMEHRQPSNYIQVFGSYSIVCAVIL